MPYKYNAYHEYRYYMACPFIVNRTFDYVDNDLILTLIAV